MPSSKKSPKFFYGWWIVAGCTLVMFYVPGTISQGFTAFFQPIADEFGWSYAQVSLGASIRGLEVGLLAPLVGFLVDRWGTRRLVFGGVIIVALGLFSLSRVHSLGTFYWSFVIIAIGMSSCVGTVFLPTVANWFRRRVGLAVGLVGAGAGLSGFLVPLITWLIDKYDWRTAMVILSISILAIGLPASLLIRHKPEPYGYLPDGAQAAPPDSIHTPSTVTDAGAPGITAGQALRTGVFWQLALASTLIAIIAASVTTHIMPYLSSVGISRSYSSTLVLVLGLATIAGRSSAGWLGDRFDTRRVYLFSLGLMMAGLLFFAYVIQGRLWLLAPFVLFYGLGAAGFATLRPVLLRRYFQRGKFGSILGIADFFMMLGQIGIPIAGWAYDTWTTYRGIWLVFAGLIVIGIIVLMTTPDYRTFSLPAKTRSETLTR